MNKYKKYLAIIFALTSIVVVATFLLNTEGCVSEVKLKTKDGIEGIPSMNVSDYIEFTGPPVVINYEKLSNPYRINIDDTNASYSWNRWKSKYTWCSGSGTLGSPYIIENLFINCKGTGGGIHIVNSNALFIIRNCWINYTGPGELDDGILIRLSINGVVTNNIITYAHASVWLEFSCSEIEVSNNYILSDHTTAAKSVGMYIGSMCENVAFNDNKIINCYNGIGGYIFENCTLKGNYIKNTLFPKDESRSPIWLKEASKSKIIYNAFEGEAYANNKEFVRSSNSFNNTVLNNTVVTKTVNSASASITIPKLQNGESDSSGLMLLSGGHDNYIAHNILYVSRSGVIPSYNILVILSMIGLISIILYNKVLKK